MNLLRIFTSLLLILGIVYPQEEEGGVYPDYEISIQVKNAPNTTISFEL